MDFGVVFAPLPGPAVSATRPFSDWMRAAETVCTTLARVGFRSIVFTHSYQYGGMQPFVTMARLAPARLVRVSHRVVFGTLDAVQQILSACGWQINTSFIERVNLTIRHHVAAVGRRVNTLCKGEDGLRQLVPSSSRANTPNGSGSAKVWHPCTPAMAAGLTEHVWSLKEVLLYRVPPWPQPQTV